MRRSSTAEAWTCAGIFHTGGMLRIADVSDGTNCTILIGEKNVVPTITKIGQDIGDNDGFDTADDEDNTRWTASWEDSFRRRTLPVLLCDGTSAAPFRRRFTWRFATAP